MEHDDLLDSEFGKRWRRGGGWHLDFLLVPTAEWL